MIFIWKFKKISVHLHCKKINQKFISYDLD